MRYNEIGIKLAIQYNIVWYLPVPYKAKYSYLQLPFSAYYFIVAKPNFFAVEKLHDFKLTLQSF